MITANVLALFDILQDKYGAPYFPDDWKYRIFNASQYAYLNDLFPDNQGGRINVEQDINTLFNVKTLTFVLDSLNMNGAGLLTNSVLNTRLVTASGDSTAKLFRILNVGIVDGSNVYPVRWIKHNNRYKFKANVFKAPSYPNNVTFDLVQQGIEFDPIDSTPEIRVTCIKAPRDISISVDPEFESDYPVYAIIAKMLKYAGIATDSQELIAEVQAAAIPQ